MGFDTFLAQDFPQMDSIFRRNLINGLSGFKSVNLVGTISNTQERNLAIFSQIFHLGATPALMGMIVRPDSVDRHTLLNIMDIGWYTFNHIREDFYKQAHQTSARYNQSEFEACNLSPYFSAKNPAPYVEESHVRIGLKLEQRINLEINGTIMVIGSVQELMIVHGVVAEDGSLDLEKAGSITCSGLDAYHKTEKIGRLSYAKPGIEPKEI